MSSKQSSNLSVPNVDTKNSNLIEVPYDQFADISRIITDGYGAIIEKSEMVTI